jgi:hypothetical protein
VPWNVEMELAIMSTPSPSDKPTPCCAAHRTRRPDTGAALLSFTCLTTLQDRICAAASWDRRATSLHFRIGGPDLAWLRFNAHGRGIVPRLAAVNGQTNRLDPRSLRWL